LRFLVVLAVVLVFMVFRPSVELEMLWYIVRLNKRVL
jgi:hypothetical protein